MECQCRREEARRSRVAWEERLLRESGIPAAFWRATLEEMDVSHPDTQTMIEATGHYLADQAVPLLLLMSHPDPRTGADQLGNGKSHCAAIIARELFYRWLDPAYPDSCPVWFVDVRVLLAQMQAGQFEEGQYYRLLRRALDTRLLVLDDLGAHRGTDWAGVQLDMIVNHRYANLLPTVITMNVTLKQLPIRLADRLRDGAVCRIVVNGAPSYRAKRGR